MIKILKYIDLLKKVNTLENEVETLKQERETLITNYNIVKKKLERKENDGNKKEEKSI